MKRISSFLVYVTLVYIIILFPGCTTETDKSRSESHSTETANTGESSSENPKKVILFFGNSLTAGYGLESSNSFPSLIQAKLDSAGFEYDVINAGVSGETTATGSNRISWVLEQQKIDVFVLELGANDGLRGVPVLETRSNLEKIIDLVRENNPDTKILLAGMMIPPSMGPEYTESFRILFPEIATEKNVELIPFLLKGVAGVDSLNLEDGIHPNAEGQKIVANNVWEILIDVL